MASNSVVDMCGHAYLYRREERRRWLLPTGRRPFSSSIDLPQFTPGRRRSTCGCARLVADGSTPHELQLHTAGRDYHLRASDEATCADWRALLEDGGGAPPRRRWAGSRSAARATRGSSGGSSCSTPTRACSRTFASFRSRRRCRRSRSQRCARCRVSVTSRGPAGGSTASCWRPPKALSSWAPRASRSATRGSPRCAARARRRLRAS